MRNVFEKKWKKGGFFGPNDVHLSVISGNIYAEGACMESIHVLHVETDPEWRQLIGEYVKQQHDMTYVASVETEEEAIRCVEQSTVNVIVIDVMLTPPHYDGLDTVQKILERENISVIFLSSVSNFEVIADTFNVGAVNFIMKHHYKDVIEAIRDAYHHRVAIHPDAAPVLCDEFRRLRLEVLQRLLTPTERQVITYLHEGYSKKKISEMMHVGFETTKTHVKHILSKLQVGNSKEAVRVAKHRGFFEMNLIDRDSGRKI